jgi:hypothetical protein
MTRRSINVYSHDGFPARLLANHQSLNDVDVNFIADDTPDRTLWVSLAVADELERMRADRRACSANTQWHGLSGAVERAAERLLGLRLQHYGDPDAMNAAIQGVVDQLAGDRHAAMHVRSADAANDGHHQQPRITTGEREPAHV